MYHDDIYVRLFQNNGYLICKFAYNDNYSKYIKMAFTCVYFNINFSGINTEYKPI